MTKDKKISELPWSANLHYHIDEPTELYISDYQENMVVSFFDNNKENYCNAEFIVKAVNNHQKLVDMVEAYTRRVNVYLKETEATTGAAISVKGKLEHLMQESGKLLKEIEDE